MEFRVLGPLEVEGNDGPVALPGLRRRSVLLRLLSARNLAVDAGALAEDVWAGNPPPGAVSTIKSHLSFLRQRIGRERIRESGGGVTLWASDEELDCACFEADLRQGLDALRTGDPAKAAHILERGLIRWRGPAFSEVDGLVWIRAEQTRLEALKAAAVEADLDARLELGQNQEVIALAEHLLAEYPFREHLSAQLMLALYRVGRQADSLRVYQQMRRRLGEALGIEPGPELAGLETSILLHRPELGGAPGGNGFSGLGLAVPPTRPPTRPANGGRGIPLPTRIAPAPAGGLVGRGNELAAAAAAVRRADERQAVEVVLVTGEAGIGKTTLVAEAARAAHAEAACILFGRGSEDLPAPYRLLTEAFEHYAAHAPPEELADHVRTHGSELVRLLPCLERRVPELPPSRATDPATERYLLFAAAVGLLRLIGRQQAAVLVLDDLQWADQASLAFLRYLLDAEGPLPLAVFGTVRDEVVAPGDPLHETIARLHGSSALTRITLGGLGPDDIATIVASAASQPLAGGEALAAYLQRETDGNPFFVNELLRHLRETGVIGDGWWPPSGDGLARIDLPPSVRSVIGARVGRLGPVAQRALRVAAVIGRDFDVALVARVARLDEDEVVDLLDRAREMALVREQAEPPGQYSFAHPVIQRSLYDDQGATRRARTHRAVALALEARNRRSSAPGAAVGPVVKRA